MPTLGDYIRIKHGYAFKGDYITTEDNGIVLVTPGNFEIGGGFKEGKCKFFSSDYPDEYVLSAGDLIVTMTDLSKQGDTLGYSARVPQSGRKYLHNQRIGLVDVFNPAADKDYIYWFMRTPRYQKTIVATASGSTVKHTSPSRICAVEIMLPSLCTQRKIAALLSSLESKIKSNKRINDNLYEMVNAYYTSLFKENDCEMTTVGNYAERIYSGGTPMTSNAAYWNGTFGWFSSGETRNRFVISTEKTITQAGIDNSSTKLATKYDIVMASAGQGFTRGQTSMLLIDTYVNQSVIVIKSERNILPYLFWNLANRYDELRAISDSSSIRGSLTTKMIAAFEIPLAKAQSLQAFADFAWSVIHQIENNLLENERLTALRDSLLPKLMSGEIDVSDIQL